LPPSDSLDLLDGDVVEFGHLSRRHTVPCQGSNATELRRRYSRLRHPLVANRAFRFWRRFGGRFPRTGVGPCHRLDRYDAWPSRRLRLGCCWRIGRGDYLRYRCNVSLWPKEVLRGLTRSVDPFAVASTVCHMPAS